MVIGLDCVSPTLVFERLAADLPHLGALRSRGVWGALRSVDPPITVPAWACMATGRDPGELGIYGFREPAPGSYGMRLVDARAVHAPRIWELAAAAGLRACALFVPPSWPPTARGDGDRAAARADEGGPWVAGCFLTPSAAHPWSDPPVLRARLEAALGPYPIDVEGFRGEGRQGALSEAQRLLDWQLEAARLCWEEFAPDLLFAVTIAPDRLYHAAWRHLDPTHPRHDPADPAVAAVRAFHARMDHHVGTLVEAAGPETTVFVVSDHGARPLRGSIAINEWLRREGWLVLAEPPHERVPLMAARVRWAETRAWGEGGYYARIFLNVRGREPEGCVSPDDAEEERDRLAAALRTMRGPDGRHLGNRVIAPERHFRAARGRPPDLMVYLGGLDWRAAGTLGPDGAVFLADNDTGADDCNHDPDGFIVAAGPDLGAREPLRDATLYDVFATVCARLGIAPPNGTLGRDLAVIGGPVGRDDGASPGKGTGPG
jgi:predicted AlkP superfamily phosphohydrolase/phosphomutase